MIIITKDNYETEVAKADGLVVIDFWATWCGPCRMLGPVLEELSNEMKDVKFCKVNVDEERELTYNYGVTSIPMLAFVKDGEVLGTSVGYKPKAALVAEIEEYK